jgi:hypothetical protein
MITLTAGIQFTGGLFISGVPISNEDSNSGLSVDSEDDYDLTDETENILITD